MSARKRRPDLSDPARLARIVLTFREKRWYSQEMRSKTPYEVIRLESWKEFLDKITDSPYHNWAFRGQRDARAPLFSALSRYLITYLIDRRAWPEQEERILRIFKRKAIHFLDHVPEFE